MGNTLYVANLSAEVDGAMLAQIFSTHGTVVAALVCTDRIFGHSKGYGFVEMRTSDEARAAKAELNGKNVSGSDLTVDMAKAPRTHQEAGGREVVGGKQRTKRRATA